MPMRVRCCAKNGGILGIAIVAILVAWAPRFSHAQSSSPASLQQATVYHERGLQLYQQGSYSDAAEQFEYAERLAHSRANLMNLARCYQALGRNRDARSNIDRYLREPDLTPDARFRAEQLRAELSSSGGGASSLAGPWALLGSGLGLILIGATLDIVAFVKSNRDEQDPFGSIPEYDDWVSSSMNLAIAGDVLVGVGTAAAVGGLVWLLLARRSGGQATAPSRRGVVSLAPTRDGGLAFLTRFRF